VENTSANVSDYELNSNRPSLTLSKEKGIVEKGF